VCLFKLKNLKSVVLAIVTAGSLICMSSCKDDPEHAEAKTARQSSTKALKIIRTSGDVNAAGKQLQKALRLSDKARPAKESAILLNANLIVERACQRQKQLDKSEKEMTGLIGEISAKLTAVKELQAEQANIDALLASGDAEIKHLTNMLVGAGQKEGLKGQLARGRAELAEFQEQIRQLEAEVDITRTDAARLPRQAADLLRQAALADGEDKIKLQRQAYNILLGKDQAGQDQSAGKTGWLTKMQKKKDEIGILQSQIALIKPGIERLQADIDTAESQIEEIRNSEQRRQMIAQLKSIQAGISQLPAYLHQIALTRRVLFLQTVLWFS